MPASLLPLADEFLPAGLVVEGPPPATATLYALDCGSAARLAVTLGSGRRRTVNIDHHHDNTRFGDLNLVDGDASSTSELVCEIADPPRPAVLAERGGGALRRRLVRHGPLSARQHLRRHVRVLRPARGRRRRPEPRLPAALRDALPGLAAAVGASDRQGAAGRGRPRPARRCSAADDFAATGASDDETEGIVDALRSVPGVEVAALARPHGDGQVRVSLRSEGFDVSAVAGLKGGGGHRQAAGFTTGGTVEEVTEWLSTVLDERLSTASF